MKFWIKTETVKVSNAVSTEIRVSQWTVICVQLADTSIVYWWRYWSPLSSSQKSTVSRVIAFSGLLVDHQSDSEAECCDVRWDSRMDNPSGGTLKRTASSCQPEGASVTSAATPRLCSGRLKICLLALVLLHTVIFISTSHNSTSVGVTAIFSPEESASSDEWTLMGSWIWCL